MLENKSIMLKDKLTVLVNSCDGYEDLWIPFFTLYRKYWDDKSVRLLLNTECKDFSFDGLQIECVHCDDSRYGARMLYALSQIETEYVLILLDDFFLRSSVDLSRILQITQWMDNDAEIACFNSECLAVYADWEVDRCPGFRRVPPGNPYILNMQGAIWRTNSLKKYWRPHVSPWEWEQYCSLLSLKYPQDKFYCVVDPDMTFLKYGHRRKGDVWGVVRGKWVLEDVVPLFEKENISVDFSKRGGYSAKQQDGAAATAPRWKWYDCVIRCLGKRALCYYIMHRTWHKVSSLFGKQTVNPDFVLYLQEKAQRRFLKDLGEQNDKG